ncbi:MAG: hypothetical protein K0V04_26920, partial [Deltaproteobacteria bacterium]|nr:hypothetical protein [Deltaproteobacteria bacterium]
THSEQYNPVDASSTAPQSVFLETATEEQSVAAACGLFSPCAPGGADPCAPCGLTCTYVYYRVEFLCLP